MLQLTYDKPEPTQLLVLVMLGACAVKKEKHRFTTLLNAKKHHLATLFVVWACFGLCGFAFRNHSSLSKLIFLDMNRKRTLVFLQNVPLR